LTVYEGLWVGFTFEKNISELTDFQIDISTLRKNKDKFEKDKKLEKLVHGLKSDLLDLNNLGEFELENKLYYQIKDLEDGNYLAIDRDGQVFGLIHDPYKIELLNKSLRQFVSDVNSGKFDFEKYINNKNGYA
jgi:hypothetical protein